MRWRHPEIGTREDICPDLWVLGVRVLMWECHPGTEDPVQVEGELVVNILLHINDLHSIYSTITTLLLSLES